MLSVVFLKVTTSNLCIQVVICLTSLTFLTADMPIRIVNIVIGNNDLYGYEATSSAYDVAFERGRRTYPDLFDSINRVTFYQPGDFSCVDAGPAMVLLMTALYSNISAQDRNDFVIVFAPGCTPEIMNLGDFTREMDAPVLASTVMDNAFANKERFPTVIAAGPSGKHLMVQAVLELLKEFNWATVSLICDERTKDATENIGSLDICNDLDLALHTRPWLYQISSMRVKIDSSKMFNFRSQILTARRHSKVLVLASIPEIQKALLAEMTDLNMTDGNYVFITFRLPQLSYYYEALWEQTDDLSIRALEALRFCFVLSTIAPDWNAIGHDRRRMIYKSWSSFQHIVPKEYQYNELQISAYETVLMTLQVLNESYTGDMELIKGEKFARLFWNRHFNLPSRPVFISKSGLRIENVIIGQYDSESSSFQRVMLFDAQQLLLTNLLSDSPIKWNNSTRFPPSSLPFCEPNNPENICQEANNQSGSGIYYIIVFIALLCAAVCLCIAYWEKIGPRSPHYWWRLSSPHETSDICKFPGTGENKTLQLALHDSEQLQLFYTLSSAGAANCETVTFNAKVFKGHVVHTVTVSCSLSFASIKRRPPVLAVLKKIHSLEHSNIALFHGLAFTPTQTIFVTEATQRGLLRTLIDSEHIMFNWDLRFSFIWDLLNGLRYIQQSSLQVHGLLSSLNCLVDQYFTVKIANSGTRDLFSALADDCDDFHDPTPSISALWMSPEALTGKKAVLSSAADVYSFGVILYELATRNCPFNVELDNSTALEITLESIRQGSFTYSELYKPAEVPHSLEKMMQQCWSREPAYRPSTHDMANTIQNCSPGQFDNFLDNLMARLEKYNLELESLIGDRTAGLVDETRKVDLILESILPKSIARRLRDKQIVLPEHFESVSILFSDIPAFDQLASQHSPLILVDLLHALYSTLDDILIQFEVYKIETIKDEYMVASGTPERNGVKHASEVARLALLMQDRISSQPFPGDIKLKLRIGINSGPCVAAVIGRKLPHYVLVGDTVNMASRMQSSGEEMKIHISAATENLLNLTGKFVMKERELIQVKGIGYQQTYWLISHLGC